MAPTFLTPLPPEDQTAVRGNGGSLASPVSTDRTLVIGFGILLAILYFVNAFLFTVPTMESSDHAVNSIMIYEAKHFRELRGNYSQFGFHHPGPALFYLLAAGEFVLGDVLHLAASPFNAHSLMMMFLNALALFASIRVASRFVTNPYFPGFAVCAAIVVACLVNWNQGSGYNSTFVSIWIPHTILFFAMLFAISSAAVAAGRITVLPLMVAAAGMLAHLHVAQVQYVVILTTLCLGVWYFRSKDQGGIPGLWTTHRAAFVRAGGVLAVFLLPLAIELVYNKPNNLTLILQYMKSNFGRHHTLSEAWLYLLRFVSLANESERFAGVPISTALGEWQVRLYMAFVMAAIGAVIARRLQTETPIPFFFKYLGIHCLVIAGLFLNWATTINGDLSPYHGHFLFGFHMLAMWVCFGLLFPGEAATEARTPGPRMLLFGAPALLLLTGFAFRMPTPDAPLVRAIYNQLPNELGGRVLLEIDSPLPPGKEPAWVYGAGLANQIHRSGRRFCVPPNWVNMFGADNICATPDQQARIQFLPPKTALGKPCKVLYEESNLTIGFIAGPSSSWPVQIQPADCVDRKEGFYGLEGPHRWASKVAKIHFTLPANLSAVQQITELTIAGGLAKAPMSILVNEVKVGEFLQAGDPASGTFKVPAGTLQAGKLNQVRLETPNAVGQGGDTRELGYLFRSLSITAIASSSR